MSSNFALHFAGLDRTVELDPARRTVLGISETCDVDLRRYLPGERIKTISRRHCEIYFVADEGYALLDLSSLNGTRVNGQLLRPGEPRFLRVGDSIRLAENPDFTIAVVGDEHCETEQLVPGSQPLAEAVVRDVLSFGQLYLADEGHFVLDTCAIPRQHFTALEEKLLRYLYGQAGRVCSYDELTHHVWGYAKYDEVLDATVAKVVSNLRKKLDDISAGAGMRHIRTVRGRGITCDPV